MNELQGRRWIVWFDRGYDGWSPWGCDTEEELIRTLRGETLYVVTSGPLDVRLVVEERLEGLR